MYLIRMIPGDEVRPLLTNPKPNVSEEFRALTDLVAERRHLASSILGGDQLLRDIDAQIKAVDEVARRVDGPGAISQRRLQVRRSASLLLGILDKPGLELKRYTGMLSRGEAAPAQSQFIAAFESAAHGQVALKAYGKAHPLEARMQQMCTAAGIKGIVQVHASEDTKLGSWLVMDRIAGRSLTGLWGSDRPARPSDSLKVTTKLATLMAPLHDLRLTGAEEFPLVGDVVGSNVTEPSKWLIKNGYGDLVKGDPGAFATRMYSIEDRVLSHGDPFAANVMQDDLGKVTLIDPSPMRAPRAYDAARWISHTGDPMNLGPITKAWLAGESSLDAAELATCLAVELHRHADVLEVVKLETGADAQTRDPETVALVETANVLRDAVERSAIQSHRDLVQTLDTVSKSLQPAPFGVN